MRRRLTYKPSLRKGHDRAVDRITENPEILRIAGLSLETLLCEPIEFPELKKKGQETGDLIFIFSPRKEIWEILVIEVQVGDRRSAGDAFFKLNLTRNYLKSHWRELFRKVGLNLPRNYILLIRTFYVSYAGKFLWEPPFVEEKKRTWIL